MNRQKFVKIAGGSIVAAGLAYYLQSDKRNFTRFDTKPEETGNTVLLNNDEKEILYLASLAPSGHNTQPWLVNYVEPYHWIIGNDKTRWLPAVDPTQRETILSIGAFLQNLEYAASSFGYSCTFTPLGTSNQDENIMEVRLAKSAGLAHYDVKKIKQRRTIRSNYLNNTLKKEDIAYLIGEESDFLQYIPNTSKEYQWLNEQTIEANRIQSYRDAAQEELAAWIRFSSEEAEKECDGLTTGSMEITGIPGWVLRNFYGKANVMEKKFREQSIDKVRQQTAQSAGWLLMMSKDNSLTALIETGRKMQRLFLSIRERNIAIHPMTQILEEKATQHLLNQSAGVSNPVQFILRTGYVKNYPEPVSLRRPVHRFIKI
jgi:nitroreductase